MYFLNDLSEGVVFTRAKQKFYTLLVLFQFILAITVYFSVNAILAVAQEGTTEVVDPSTNEYDVGMWLALSAAIAVGLSGLGAGYAIKTTGTAAISVLAERPEEFMKGFLVVALGEALAIYGLIVAILLWNKIPN
ncbi:ATP synthase subunit C [Candidatus Lokiarchaeum ossiferum]|uniref:ATP synthase subunit C n=1 Tax=Candidatus Lokiarchaeum ossiferum TaxID=2951803 RepID=UPI00352E3B55